MTLTRYIAFRETDRFSDVLDRGGDGADAEARALRQHLAVLREEQSRLAARIASVAATIETLEGGGELMAETMFDGFDHMRHRDEVAERWGADAYASGDAWWRSRSAAEKATWQAQHAELAEAWRAAAERRIRLDGDEAQALAERQVAWLAAIPGTPAAAGDHVADYLRGLGELYVADPRFAANYADAASFVRDALAAWADAH